MRARRRRGAAAAASDLGSRDRQLDAALAQGGTVSLTGLPSETPSSLYYATVRAWNSGAPQAVQNQSYPSAIDLRSNKSGAIELTVN